MLSIKCQSGLFLYIRGLKFFIVMNIPKIGTVGMLLLMVCMMQTVEAQRFVGFAAAGANFSQIEGDDVHGFYKVGANGGLGVSVALNQKQTWHLSLELLYTQKGSRKTNDPGYFDTLNYAPSMFQNVDRTKPFDPRAKCKISLDYVQIPLLVHFEEMYSGCTFGLGFAWSRLVRAHEVYNGFTRTITARSGDYKKSDWSVVADINVRLYKNLNLNFRYEYSLVPVRRTDFEYMRNDGSSLKEEHKFFNNQVSVRLLYNFNQKFYKNTRVNKYGQRMGTKWLREVPTYND